MLSRMVKLPSLELLEATHKFPGNYTVKAIGRGDSHFVALVVAAIREVLGLDQDPPYTLRESGSSAHVAITLELHLDSAAQVHAIYHRLVNVPGLVLLL
jgi:putative lipoic acid-binding regulatory protein